MTDHTKLAVFFPGVGYHTDKPLLYYTKKLAAAYGYEIAEVPYGNFPPNVKDSCGKMKQAFTSALSQTEILLKNVDFSKYERLLFVSKSIGTAVSAAYGDKYDLKTDNIYFTPVEETFRLIRQNGIVFHGTKDPWIKTAFVREACSRLDLPLYITENANHSLETGDAVTDLKNLQSIMEQCQSYIEALAR